MGFLSSVVNTVKSFGSGWTGYGSQSYRAGSSTPGTACWHPNPITGDSAIRESWYPVGNRVRDMIRNDPILGKAKDQIALLVVGDGIRSMANSRDNEGNAIEDYNLESDFWWREWEYQEADYRREFSFTDMTRVALTEMLEVGNAFFIETINRDNEICPLSYQMLEWEQISREMDRPGDDLGGGRIENGIEYDRKGRKTALYIYSVHPYGSMSWQRKTVRIPWSRVLHFYLPTRVSASVGESWFTSMVLTARDIDRYLGYEISAAAISSLLAMVVKSENPNAYGSACGDGSLDVGISPGDPISPAASQVRLSAGEPKTAVIGINESVEIAESNRPNRNAKDFIDLMLNFQAMGCGLSVNRLTGDPSRANFASIKASHEDDGSLARYFQRYLRDHVIFRIRSRWTELAVANRTITTVTANQYMRQRVKFNTFKIIPPAQPSVDVRAETEAMIARLRSGTTTLEIECAKFGLDYRDVIKSMAETNELLEANNVIVDWSKGQGGQLLHSSSVAPDEEELAQATGQTTNNESEDEDDAEQEED